MLPSWQQSNSVTVRHLSGDISDSQLLCLMKTLAKEQQPVSHSFWEAANPALEATTPFHLCTPAEFYRLQQ